MGLILALRFRKAFMGALVVDSLQEKTVLQSFNIIMLILSVDLELLIWTNFNTNLLIEALVKYPSYIY